MPRAPLSQERILDKAHALVRRDGVEALSIRQLAQRLQVTPMAIYRHFDDKDALLSALLDRFIRNARVLPERRQPWDQMLRHVGRNMWQALVSEPAWMSLLGSVRLRAGAMNVMVECVDVLQSAGFTKAEAMEAFFAMVHAGIGAALLDISFKKLDLNAPFDLDEITMKRVLKGTRSLNDLINAHQIERSLDLIIEGLRNRV